jgi:membrane associated rhomboid family serine protease
MQAEEKKIARSFIIPVLFAALLWLIKLIQIHYSIDLIEYGIFPRSIDGLLGIITMPFIHDNINHVFSNTIPLIILGSCLIYFYNELWLKVVFWVWLLDGFWLWLGGRPAWHIGASGLVYGLASFLLLSGLLRREKRLMALSLLVVFLYGGMVWGVFPFLIGVSWEAHLFGFFSGALMAFVLRKQGPQRLAYEWENELEGDEINTETPLEDHPENEPTENNNGLNSIIPEPIKIVYDYKDENNIKSNEE